MAAGFSRPAWALLDSGLWALGSGLWALGCGLAGCGGLDWDEQGEQKGTNKGSLNVQSQARHRARDPTHCPGRQIPTFYSTTPAVDLSPFLLSAIILVLHSGIISCYVFFPLVKTHRVRRWLFRWNYGVYSKRITRRPCPGCPRLQFLLYAMEIPLFTWHSSLPAPQFRTVRKDQNPLCTCWQAHCTSVMHTQVLPGYLCIVQRDTGVATRGAACSARIPHLPAQRTHVMDHGYPDPDNGDKTPRV